MNLQVDNNGYIRLHDPNVDLLIGHQARRFKRGLLLFRATIAEMMIVADQLDIYLDDDDLMSLDFNHRKDFLINLITSVFFNSSDIHE
jgi:hypothetical protein